MTTSRLGILVNTNRHPEYVRQLARAAGRLDKQVHVHFFGEGLELVDHPALAELGRVAEVTLPAAAGADGNRRGAADRKRSRIGLNEFFRACDRCLVF